MNKDQNQSILLPVVTNPGTRIAGYSIIKLISQYIRLRHCIGNSHFFTVVLGVIIWFLMVPPIVNAPWKIDVQAPLRQWHAVGTFETEQECDHAMSAAHASYEAHATATIGSIKKGPRAFALQMVFSECVSQRNASLKLTGAERPPD